MDTDYEVEMKVFNTELVDLEWEGQVNRRSPDYIKWVQQSLNRILGLSLAVDGIIGSATRSAIRRFQEHQSLTVDGIVGSQTERALIEAGAGQPPQGAGVPSSGTSASVNTPLPASGRGFYSYVATNRRYGQPETIRALQAIGQMWQRAHPGGPRIGSGDISFQGGGNMPPHKSHQTGLDADIRPMRSNGTEGPVRYQDPTYSRTLTQELISLITNNGVLRVQYIFFNDPGAQGVRKWPGHDNHLHVRFYPPSATPPSSGTPLNGRPATTTSNAQVLGNNIVNIAIQEWEKWGRGTIEESDTRMESVLRDYWEKGAGRAYPGHNHAWSAAFISWVVRKAGAGNAFTYSAQHVYYVAAAKRNRLANNPNPFKAYRVDELTPQVGDIVCMERCVEWNPDKSCKTWSGVTYDNVDDGHGRASHCAIVVQVQPGKLVTIGGNESGGGIKLGSVRRKTIPIDSNGYVRPHYYAVIRVGA